MELLTAIFTRTSIPIVDSDPIPREVIQKLLEAGNQAPNHHKVRPWRFIVLTGAVRERLGNVMEAYQKERQPYLPPAAFEKTRGLLLRAPVVIAVGVDKPAPDTRVIEIENVCAASAACQNILLAAHDRGLGAMWRTGEWARDPGVKTFLGLAPDQHLIAFIYIGYPKGETKFNERPPVDDRVTWLE